MCSVGLKLIWVLITDALEIVTVVTSVRCDTDLVIATLENCKHDSYAVQGLVAPFILLSTPA
jgi:hypothetical protein